MDSTALFGLPIEFWSTLFALFIGLIVSLDVSGLILAQWKSFTVNPTTQLSHKTPWKQALLHGSVHAVLFAVYLSLVFFLIDFVGYIFQPLLICLGALIPDIGFLKWLKSQNINYDEMRKSFVLLTGSFIILFVWYTYKDKLFDNYESRPETSNISEQSISRNLPDLRFDVKLIHRLFEIMAPNRGNHIDFALSLAVAVDRHARRKRSYSGIV